MHCDIVRHAKYNVNDSQNKYRYHQIGYNNKASKACDLRLYFTMFLSYSRLGLALHRIFICHSTSRVRITVPSVADLAHLDNQVAEKVACRHGECPNDTRVLCRTARIPLERLSKETHSRSTAKLQLCSFKTRVFCNMRCSPAW